MQQLLELCLSPEQAFNEEALQQIVNQKLGIKSEAAPFHLLNRSIDARSSQIKVNLKLRAFINEAPSPRISYNPANLPFVAGKPVCLVIGAGPAGIFAALELIAQGIKPIVIDRGKDVQARRKDLANINKANIVNPESNYCFGEGGAGTYSDGKLYTRSTKRGNVLEILEMMVAHGAKEEILAEAHPHIGTNKLPRLVAALRETIIEHGGEVLFNSKVTDFHLLGNEIKGVYLSSGELVEGEALILATGHSARDIFELLHKKNILIEAKPFALGMRVEHPQALINEIQYKRHAKNEYLPSASYSLVEQVSYKGVEKGVFSFCMCPGGFIVPASTAQEELVVNGMSPSKRDGKFANSGMVVSVEAEDWEKLGYKGPLGALNFQSSIEKACWESAGRTQTAPAKNLLEFVENKKAQKILSTSYQPGLVAADPEAFLPPFIAERMKQAFKRFGTKMRGYYTGEAQVIGVESRTSSPVRIPRDKETLLHPQYNNFYPCAEGAGYAGGIMSAAIDGKKCGFMAAQNIKTKRGQIVL